MLLPERFNSRIQGRHNGRSGIHNGRQGLQNAAQSPPFSPQQLPDLAAWYRFGQGITSAGGLVSVWADASGRARNLLQATGTNQPTLNADGSILFDGVDNWLKTAAFTLNQPVTVYALMKQLTWTLSDIIWDGDAVNSYLVQDNVTPMLRLVGVADNTDLAVNTYGVLVTVLDGASSAIQVNNGATTTGNAGAGNPGGFTLGTRGDVSAQWANIEVKEVIIYNAAHAAGTRARVYEYLRRLGGL